MVKKILQISLWLCLGSSSWLMSEPLKVQSALAPVKNSDELGPGQRFECLTNVRLEVEGCPVYFSEGSIGIRVSDTEFFIASGQVRLGALSVAQRGARKSEIIFRFYRGRLVATGLEWLSIKSNGEVRWFKEALTGPSSVEIDGLACIGEEQTLWLATQNNRIQFDRGIQKEIRLEDFEKLSLEELSLRFHRRQDAARPALNPTSEGLQPKGQTLYSLEKSRDITFGRRYGAKP